MSLPQVGTRWAGIIIFTDFFQAAEEIIADAAETRGRRRGGMGRYIVNNEWIEGEVEDNEDEIDNTFP